MNVLLMLLMMAGDPATCPMHAEHMAAKHTAVDQRGDKVMGFSHETTKHTFRLLADGGAVEVRATKSGDTETLAAIRGHLQEIAGEFKAGNFTKPEEIHAGMPHGVDVMTELGDAVEYRYEDVENGGRVRIVTKDERGIDAVHRFLRFQIDDHHTGDSAKVE
jgi:hypothetical protein